MTAADLADILSSSGYDDVVLFSNFDYADAFIGVTTDGIAVYDYDKMVKWLVDTQDFTELDAVEWIDYNTLRSLPYTEGAPIVVHSLDSLK